MTFDNMSHTYHYINNVYSVGAKHIPSISSSKEHDVFHVEDNELTSLRLDLKDKKGSLENALRVFWKYDANLTHIESKPNNKDDEVSFTMSFKKIKEKDNHELLNELSQETNDVLRVKLLPSKTVPWFPRKVNDLDSFSQKTLDAGSELESDHPGFKDVIYRERRTRIVQAAQTYKEGQEIPRQLYSKEEIATWGVVYERLKGLYPKYACKEFNDIFPQLEQYCGYASDNIPQLQDISNFLKSKTGFTLRPVGGLLSARDFLNALAFRVFYSTQYIRHHSMPLYTPEPDILHELMGHAPMFADSDFADFSHEIGLASLGASDNDIKRLASCYWFSVEFGICKQDNEMKAYGAGLLSSFGELEYSCGIQQENEMKKEGEVNTNPNYLSWDPLVAATLPYPITTYQPTYFVADNMADAKYKMRDFCESEIKRPFHVRYNYSKRAVVLDRPVQRGKYTVTLQK